MPSTMGVNPQDEAIFTAIKLWQDGHSDWPTCLKKIKNACAGLNQWGHKMDAKDKPTLDDDGEYSSYAKCSQCGVVENTKESILDCPHPKKEEEKG